MTDSSITDLVGAAHMQLESMRRNLDTLRAAGAFRLWEAGMTGAAERKADKDREIASAILPSPGAIAEAIRATEYKYFGYYELDESQHNAVETLVAAARVCLRNIQRMKDG